MAEPILSIQKINRATLARQMLLERAALAAPDGIARLVGMQAQPPCRRMWGCGPG